MEKDGKAGDKAAPPRNPNSLIERWKTDELTFPDGDDHGFYARQKAEFERLCKLHPNEDVTYEVKL
ncbi:MAG: hypothetical protein K6A65_01235 [Succinivibrionaceae bacterium]|nr:hypothetical protein [Succinivibrionaceae bacterium]